MSERKRRNADDLSKGRQPYRVEPRPTGRHLRCSICGGQVVIKAPKGAWVAFCPACREVVETSSGPGPLGFGGSADAR